MDLQKQFQKAVAAFLKAYDMAPAAFGRAAMSDPNFVLDLEAGRAPNLRTIERARAFMEAHRRQAGSDPPRKKAA